MSRLVKAEADYELFIDICVLMDGLVNGRLDHLGYFT